MWHNELINVWSHLVASLFIVFLIIYISFNYSMSWKEKALYQINGKKFIEIKKEKLFILQEEIVYFE